MTDPVRLALEKVAALRRYKQRDNKGERRDDWPQTINVPSGLWDEIDAALAAPARDTQPDDALDAARYRKLRDQDPDAELPVIAQHKMNDWGNWCWQVLSGEEADAAIDAAMAPATPREGE